MYYKVSVMQGNDWHAVVAWEKPLRALEICNGLLQQGYDPDVSIMIERQEISEFPVEIEELQSLVSYTTDKPNRTQGMLVFQEA
jgi:hypothetical protein